MSHRQSSEEQPLSFLFVCTGNACRSQMAEGWARHLLAQSALREHFRCEVRSAGLEAHGLTPAAVAVMQEVGIDISGQTSDVLAADTLDGTDWVITLCDHARKHCPALPAGTRCRHWPVADPAQAAKAAADPLAPFRAARDEIQARLVVFIGWLEQALTEDPGLNALIPIYGPEDVEVERQTLYRGFFEIQQLRLRHRLYEGGDSEPFERELFIRAPAVVVLLYDPHVEAVVMIEQFRIGALEDPLSPWLLELVAGIAEPGEALAEVARRETLEEAGCRILHLEQIMQFWLSPGGSSEQTTLFCGQVDAREAGGIHGLDEEHEDIRVRVVPVKRALQALAAGLIRNVSSIAALQWLQLHQTELRARWLQRDQAGRSGQE